MNDIVKKRVNPVRVVTAVLGVFLAVAGIQHGVFETLQGSKATPGLIIQSIGLEYQRWPNGDEAFTLVPNFLATGICAIAAGLAAAAWSVFFVHRRRGRLVFLLLFVALTLVGGGIGFIPFYLCVWAYATRMDKPLSFWGRVIRPGARKALGVLWPAVLPVSALCLFAATEISFFGLPGTSDEGLHMTVIYSLLLAAFVLLHVSYISGFAWKLRKREAG
ncbi:MAG: hypothetical protein JXD23_05970 [Spirochaetales bacterium]|nr:hypothetical protein [Spirochaetales bacterium]